MIISSLTLRKVKADIKQEKSIIEAAAKREREDKEA